MARKVYFEPHPDDNYLSMGLATFDALELGDEVHVVAMTNGWITPESIDLDGVDVCGYCGYKHNPAKEGYTIPTSDQLAQFRLQEGRAMLGQLAALSTTGSITYHAGPTADRPNDPMPLQGGFGGTGSTPTAAAIAAAQEIIKYYVDAYSNTYFYTMSYVDKHPDHAACGQALQNLRQSNELSTWGGGLTYAQALVNSRFMISRLWWNDPSIVQNGVAQVPGLSWYNAGTRYDGDCVALRTALNLNPYQAWNPVANSFAIGYHQVVGQFHGNYDPGVSIANKMHA